MTKKMARKLIRKYRIAITRDKIGLDEANPSTKKLWKKCHKVLGGK